MPQNKPRLSPVQKVRRELKRLVTPKPRVKKTDMAHLSSLATYGQGRRCFIIGNGPSLCAEDLDKIKGQPSFASNKIYLIFDQTEWRPNFYSVEDALVMRQCAKEIAALKGSVKLMPLTMLHEASRTDDMTVFPVIAPRDWDEPLNDPYFPRFSSDFSEGIAWGSTIVYTQIQLAVAMGFGEICILGLDHSYVEGRKVSPGVLVSEGEQNHFHADYRPKGEIWHSPNLHVLERSYARAQEMTEKSGVKILNCSRRSCLNTFERRELDEILDKTTLDDV